MAFDGRPSLESEMEGGLLRRVPHAQLNPPIRPIRLIPLVRSFRFSRQTMKFALRQ